MTYKYSMESFLSGIYPDEYLAYEGTLLSAACEADDAANPGFLNRVKARIRQFVEWLKKIVKVIKDKLHAIMAKIRNKDPKTAQPVDRKVKKENKEFVLKESKLVTDVRDPNVVAGALYSAAEQLQRAEPHLTKIRHKYEDIMKLFANVAPGSLDNIDEYIFEDEDAAKVTEICAAASHTLQGDMSSLFGLHGDVKFYTSQEGDENLYNNFTDQKDLYEKVKSGRINTGSDMSYYIETVRSMEDGIALTQILTRNTSKYSQNDISMMNRLVSQATKYVTATQVAENLYSKIFQYFYDFSHSFYTVFLYEEKDTGSDSRDETEVLKEEK